MDNALPRRTDAFSEYQPAQSPLFMVMRNPVLHQFISYLAEKKRKQERSPGHHVTIELSRRFVAEVREAFRADILAGEIHLHILSHVLACHLLGEEFDLYSNVIGELPGAEKRPFLIREKIPRGVLFSETDVDLGNLVLQRFRYCAGEHWSPLELSANFVEYIPVRHPVTGVNRLTSRVKAEEELWNKVADELFELDELVLRDKQFQQYNNYIKDVFGIKIICDSETACMSVHERLRNLDAASCDWRILDALPLPFPGRASATSPHRMFEFIETKDYLTPAHGMMKKTGWKALKSVVRWDDQLFEIQVQPLANYLLELDHMSGPSHHSFKMGRDALRDEVQQLLPLYGVYRDLLKSLFMNTEVSFVHRDASVVLTE